MPSTTIPNEQTSFLVPFSDDWKSFFRATPFVTKRGSPIETKAVFMIEEGRPGAQLVSKA